jgi:predicted DCC family thiol-disulfide oxidoreductase YuxK
MQNKSIVVFDGVCNFCNGSVNFIIARDPAHHFIFASVQSETGIKVLREFGFDERSVDTFVLIKAGRCFVRTDAALEIAKGLSAPWPIFHALKIIPRPIRDCFYRLLADNRYRLFGKRESCVVPTSEVRSRFL